MATFTKNEDRVWIMDPEILEDSARDHRDTPPVSPSKKPQAVSFIDSSDTSPADVSGQISSTSKKTATPSVSFDLTPRTEQEQRPTTISFPSYTAPPVRSYTPLSSPRRDMSGNSLVSQASQGNLESQSNAPTQPRSGGPAGMSRSFSRPINAAISNSATREQVELNLMEKQYLLACERGDLASVRHYLVIAQSNKSFNINCVDPLGQTALLIAIENENIEMIETLLEANIETGDAILYAINEENVEAVEIILNHLEKNDRFNIETQGVVITEHSAFTPDITPIILAAHRDNYEIIKLLLDRGASIPHPHDVRCSCRECLASVAEDSLRLSRSRINAYRALASPSLICLSARDPILYAFELSWELRRLSNIENEFKTEYQELSQKCQKFGVGLLDQTRGSKELEIILNHDTTDRWPIRDRAPGERMQLARLKLAVQFRQKRFVAHPNCQQLLASIWYEGLPGFRRRNIVFKLLLILCVSLSFPVLSLCYLLMPTFFLSRFTKKPFVKFLCHSASYVFFLILLIMASQRINYDELFNISKNYTEHVLHGDPNMTAEEKAADPDRKEKRGPPPTPVEWAIMAWVAGLIWVEIKQLWDMGLYEYCHNMWNILDFITNSLYLATLTLRFIAYIQVERENANPLTAHLGRKLPRKHWHAWDPTLISECIFATANIFSSLKLVHIFTVNPHLGPLQISLGRMIIDILKFFFVYSLVLFAFACGLNQLFWYYASMRSQECAQYHEILAENKYANLDEFSDLLNSCDTKYSSFANLFNTLETLFWSIFGLVDLENLDLKENHSITEWAGKTMFGTYSIISIVVLLNMLIAMMSNSYQTISNQADVEWKFARSKLWIEYFEDGGTLPPPFNIIPSPKSFYYVIKWFFDKFCKCLCSRRIAQTKQRSLRKTLKKVSEREAKYKFVMRNLVKRYIAHIQRAKQQSEGVSEDDVNEIKQDISAFRYELLEILRNSGYNTGHANIAQKTTSRSKKRSAQAERRLMKGFQLNVDPIPEVDRFLPKMPDLDDGSGCRGSQTPPGKSASAPALSSTLSKFKKLSTRMRLGKKHTDPTSLHRGVVRNPKSAPGHKRDKGVMPRSVSVELEERGAEQPQSHSRFSPFSNKRLPLSGTPSLSQEIIPEETEESSSVALNSAKTPTTTTPNGKFLTAENPVWTSLPGHVSRLSQPQTTLGVHNRSPVPPPPLSKSSLAERDSYLWRTMSTEDETVSGNSSGTEWGFQGGGAALRTDSKGSRGLEMEAPIDQSEDTLL